MTTFAERFHQPAPRLARLDKRSQTSLASVTNPSPNGRRSPRDRARNVLRRSQSFLVCQPRGWLPARACSPHSGSLHTLLARTSRRASPQSRSIALSSVRTAARVPSPSGKSSQKLPRVYTLTAFSRSTIRRHPDASVLACTGIAWNRSSLTTIASRGSRSLAQKSAASTSSTALCMSSRLTEP